MKCVECADYAECRKQYNLTIKRKHCSKAKAEYVQTNADRIRAMSDEELAKALIEVNDSGCHIPFCKELPECQRLLDEGEIPEEKCIVCMLNWLQQPAEGE